jgi:hypothetical protein
LEGPDTTGNETNPASTPAHRFFVSDYTPTFEKIAQQFFGKVVKLELA